jgi:hypothetical protein
MHVLKTPTGPFVCMHSPSLYSIKPRGTEEVVLWGPGIYMLRPVDITADRMLL